MLDDVAMGFSGSIAAEDGPEGGAMLTVRDAFDLLEHWILCTGGRTPDGPLAGRPGLVELAREMQDLAREGCAMILAVE